MNAVTLSAALFLCFSAVTLGAEAPVAAPAERAEIEAEVAALFVKVDETAGRFTEPAKPEDKTWVQRRLKHLVEVDQLARAGVMSPKIATWSEPGRKLYFDRISLRLKEIDRANTAELKALLQRYRWFTVSEFSKETDGNAWLLVQHADQDVAFQQQVLVVLTTLWESGETNPRNYAYLWDRVAVNTGKPQRYGTQGRCVGPGAWEPQEVENPDQLEARRHSVGLQPMAEYKALFKERGLCQAASPQ